MKQYLGVVVPKQYDALRLDAFLKRTIPPLERITLLRMLKDKEVRVEKASNLQSSNNLFQIEPIQSSDVKETVLATLLETEPAIINTSTSNFFHVSSASDKTRRSELAKIESGLKLSAGDMIILPKWINKLLLTTGEEHLIPPKIYKDRVKVTNTADTPIQSTQHIETKSSGSFSPEDAMLIPSTKDPRKTDLHSKEQSKDQHTTDDTIKENEEFRNRFSELGYGTAMISQRLAGGADALSGQSRMSIGEARELEAKLAKWVLYQDEYVLVLNKPYDMAVHQGTKISRAGHIDKYLDAVDVLNRAYRSEAENPQPSPLDSLRAEFQSKEVRPVVPVDAKPSPSLSTAPFIRCLERPRLVHRLDRECSGLLIISKSRLGAKALGAQFAGLSLDTSAKSLYEEEEYDMLYSNSNLDQGSPTNSQKEITGFDVYRKAIMPSHLQSAFKIAKTYWAITVPFNFAHVSEITKKTAALYNVGGYSSALNTSNMDHDSTEKESTAGSKVQLNGIRMSPVKEKTTPSKPKAHRIFSESAVTQGFSSTVDAVVAAFSSQWKSLSLLETSKSPSTAGQIDLPIDYDKFEAPKMKNGKPVRSKNVMAKTKEKVLIAISMFVEMKRLANKCSLVAMQPLTGRKHQLRIHCADPEGLDAPIIGDKKYSSSNHVLNAQFFQQIRDHIQTKYKLTPNQSYEKTEDVLGSLHLHCRSMTFQHPAFCRELAHLVSDEERAQILQNIVHAKKNMTVDNSCSIRGDRDSVLEPLDVTNTKGLVTVVAPLSEHMKITMEAFGSEYDSRPDILVE